MAMNKTVTVKQAVVHETCDVVSRSFGKVKASTQDPLPRLQDFGSKYQQEHRAMRRQKRK